MPDFPLHPMDAKQRLIQVLRDDFQLTYTAICKMRLKDLHAFRTMDRKLVYLYKAYHNLGENDLLFPSKKYSRDSCSDNQIKNIYLQAKAGRKTVPS